MITYSPQRSDNHIASYELSDNVLTITINGVSEVFDFTDFTDGIAEEITPDKLPLNPIVSLEKINGEVHVTVIKFYGESEKHEYES